MQFRVWSLPAVILLASLTPVSVLAVEAKPATSSSAPPAEASMQPDDGRMDWWREARFGLFIHWGLYAVPAGEWGDSTNHGEWIMNSGQIPVEDYEPFVDQFNPVHFDADEWVRMAKDAGMKYIVITTKHHDGFCLFDSQYTEYDIAATPFRRDIMEELAEACRRAGIRICWYHSIMDWHHPDYLPRRPWESRPEDGADFDRYIAYLKNQVSELVTRYGDIGVLWFDGEWERTWNHAHGKDLYEHVRSLQPSIIVNNRVDVGRGGMEGMSKSNKYKGDFGTPEQQIPATGIPGVDWETCMTMNRHWGYNQNDEEWKSSEDLIQKLADIASKGGNFLLNVGPTAAGRFPQPSIDRLADMGRWMTINGESIYGTQASPFPALTWGRCTVKQGSGDRWLVYLHVFDWPDRGELVVPALDNTIHSARLLASPSPDPLTVQIRNRELVVALPEAPPDPIDSVILVEITGRPVVVAPPSIEAESTSFIDEVKVTLATDVREVDIHYTVDGTAPSPASPRYKNPLKLREAATVRAQLFRSGQALSDERRVEFTRIVPRAAEDSAGVTSGLRYEYVEGHWEQLPEFDELKPVATGVTPSIDLGLRKREEHFGLRFTGFIQVPAEAVYSFYSDSDDGSRVFIGDQLVVENDGLHSPTESSGQIALAAGRHPITILFFESTGGQELTIGLSAPGLDYRPLPSEWLFHR